MACKAAIYTLGCKVNQYESKALMELLQKEGFVEVNSGADVCIINTCAVTAESERKARQTVRKAIKDNPGAYVLVTGCASQIHSKEFSAIEGVDFVNGNREKKELVAHILQYTEKGEKRRGQAVSDLTDLPYEELELSSSERTRAFIKIEDGCESRCAYCIIPQARGPVRSRLPERCVAEAERLADAGYKEIVLTGIEVSAYGQDLKNTDLGDLILALEKVEGLERLRLSSIDPSFLRPAFVAKIADTAKLSPHLHLSLQSGCDETLNRMRRKYNTALVLRNIDYLRKRLPQIRFTADVIVGFPGETEEEFAKTCAFLGQLELLHTHVFPYSRRPGTEADRMPMQIPEEVKSRRSAELIGLCNRIRDRVLAQEEGKIYRVLFEQGKEGLAVGHTANFIEVAVKTDRHLTNSILPVRLGKNKEGIVEGFLE